MNKTLHLADPHQRPSHGDPRSRSIYSNVTVALCGDDVLHSHIVTLADMVTCHGCVSIIDAVKAALPSHA